jgi:hypothetical protein
VTADDTDQHDHWQRLDKLPQQRHEQQRRELFFAELAWRSGYCHSNRVYRPLTGKGTDEPRNHCEQRQTYDNVPRSSHLPRPTMAGTGRRSSSFLLLVAVGVLRRTWELPKQRSFMRYEQRLRNFDYAAKRWSLN